MSFTLNSGFNAEFIKLDIRAILNNYLEGTLWLMILRMR